MVSAWGLLDEEIFIDYMYTAVMSKFVEKGRSIID